MKDKKSIIISIIVIFVALGGIFAYNKVIQGKAMEGHKQITIKVINDVQKHNKEYKHNTDAVSLTDALKEMKISEIENGQYGSFIVSVDDYKANESKQEWWKIVVNGKDAETGIDSIMINDGDKIELVLTVGW